MNTKNILKFTIAAAVLMVVAGIFLSFRNGNDGSGMPVKPHQGETAANTGSGPGAANSGATGGNPTHQGGTAANTKTAADTVQSQAPLPPAIPQDVQAATGTAVAEAPAAVARVTIGGQQQSLTPNEIGNYPKVYIEQKATVPVTISFPKGEANEPVLVYTPDGGHINDRQNGGKALYLDGKKTINFNFEANADRGLYRVVVTKGSETTVIQFWAGAETPFATR